MKEKEVALVEAMVVMDCHRNDRKSELENIGIDLKMLHQQCGGGGGPHYTGATITISRSGARFLNIHMRGGQFIHK